MTVVCLWLWPISPVSKDSWKYQYIMVLVWCRDCNYGASWDKQHQRQWEQQIAGLQRRLSKSSPVRIIIVHRRRGRYTSFDRVFTVSDRFGEIRTSLRSWWCKGCNQMSSGTGVPAQKAGSREIHRKDHIRHEIKLNKFIYTCAEYETIIIVLCYIGIRSLYSYSLPNLTTNL